MDKELLDRFFLNECSGLERYRVIVWLLNPENDNTIRLWLSENWEDICKKNDDYVEDGPDLDKIWSNIRRKINEEAETLTPLIPIVKAPGKPFILRKVLAIAASFLLLIFSTLAYLNYSKKKYNTDAISIVPAKVDNDVKAPGNAKAILTLGDGTVILLDSVSTGDVAKDPVVDIVKNENGTLVYKPLDSLPATITYNTLSLPRGSKPIKLVLSDGTFVWLNAGSSLTFPTLFTGKERKVDMNGEAYFEVARNEEKPFYVNTGAASIRVLGTHFNINNYVEETDTKVTLLEGKVNVLFGGQTEVLKPGQQASLKNSRMSVKSDVDIEEVMAWKDGRFYFSGTDFKSMMRQIERHYDVEVEYQDQIPYQFVVKIPRDVNMSELLKRLEITGLVHFEIRDRRVIVKK